MLGLVKVALGEVRSPQIFLFFTLEPLLCLWLSA